MKIKKWILVVAFGIFLVSLYVAIATDNGTKINNIFIGLMGSSLVSLLIELPDYWIGKAKNKKMFIDISSNIWLNLNNFLFFINMVKKEENKIVTANTFLDQIEQINRIYMQYNLIDRDLFIEKPKYKEFFEKSIRIFEEINYNDRVFKIYLTQKKIEALQIGKNENIKAFEMKKQIGELEEITKKKLGWFEEELLKIMNKKEIDFFIKNKEIINNVNENFKFEEVRFK